MMSRSVSGTTMPTPTSDLTLAPEAPAGLPDVATLARMANAFFTALPGALPVGLGAPLPPSLPADLPGADVGPRPSSVPGGLSPSASIPTSAIPGGVTPGTMIPSGVIPSADTPGAAISGATAPFYFLDFVGSGWDVRPDFAAATLGNLAGLTAQATALPSTVDLGVLRAPQAPVSAPTGTGPAFGGAPSFYFLESSLPTAEVAALQNLDRHPPFNVAAIRRDFPILAERINGRPLIWLDNAATTQKPQAVIDRLSYFYAHENSNIHRAAHELAARATDAYEGARATVQRFLGASSPAEIVFVRGATEAINLVAQSWGRQNILAGDEIIISHLEHHANIVPWQQLASEKGARLRVIPVDDSGQILLDEYQKLLGSRTKMVAITQVSNALGTIVPVREVAELAHRAGARVLIDGAQAVSHLPVDVQALGADFYVFSGHKVFGPTGIGALYGTAEILESMPPWQGGGNMIAAVTFDRTSYQKPPARFEAGTGNIADAAGLAAALDYVSRIGMANIDRYEHDLLSYATAALKGVRGLRLIGTAQEKASVLSFVLDGYDPVEVGTALNQEGIAVRAGHHCAEPILHRFGVKATVRPSLAFYNTCEEVDTLTAALHRLAERSGRK
jgi:cysteine desulfurase/selenocysteine lyase